MKKRGFVTALALLITFGLARALPVMTQKDPAPEKGVRVLRVWIAEEEKAVGAWLKNRAAAYEKQEKVRVYLRSASMEEARRALAREAGIVVPDVIVTPGQESLLALRGYGLFVRDRAAALPTEAPKGALFSRPTPTPQKEPERVTVPDEAVTGPVLCPEELVRAVPGGIASEDSLAAFMAGQAEAAVLTAGQAGKLPFGCAGYPLADGFLQVTAAGLTEEGQALIAFLRGRSSQFALGDAGLYSFLPDVRLYDERQPLRALIERGLYTVSSPAEDSTTLNSSR